MWDSVGDQPAESYPNHTFTRATVWDPRTNTSKQVNVTGYNIFCAGYVQLADGRVLVAGGNKSQASRKASMSGWRNRALSSKPILASRQLRRPSAVTTE